MRLGDTIFARCVLALAARAKTWTARAGAIVVLHDLALAAAYADRIVVMSEGRVAGEGPPAEVLQPELLSEVYWHSIEVHRHPGTGAALVTPRRG